MTVLVTGFLPFDQAPFNPAAAIVEHLRGAPTDLGVVAEVLPTEYRAAERRVMALLAAAPSAYLCVGVAVGETHIRLERFAYNLDECEIPDNINEVRRHRTIRIGAAAVVESTLPLDALHADLTSQKIPVAWSDDPGRFVCNHVFFTALDFIRRRHLPTRCGLIHVPMNSEAASGIPALPLELLTNAVISCIRLIQSDQPYRRACKPTRSPT